MLDPSPKPRARARSHRSVSRSWRGRSRWWRSAISALSRACRRPSSSSSGRVMAPRIAAPALPSRHATETSMGDRPTLAGKSVLVLGGAGFIGSHLVDRLADERPRRVSVVDNLYLGREENLADARTRLE